MSARWFLPGLLLAAVLALAWRWRHCWGRPVLMLVVCYVALLLPVLGFVNVYFMEYSLVADHWQYAAMIVPCAVFAGLVSRQWSLVSGRWSVVGRGQRTTDNGQRTTDVHPSSFILHSFSVAGAVLCTALLATLAWLTWRQSSMYADAEGLYVTTIRQNHGCWLAYNNLGVALMKRGQLDEALANYQRAVELKSDRPDIRNNLGLVLEKLGQTDEATAQFQEALKLEPDFTDAHNNLGNALAETGTDRRGHGALRKGAGNRP